jgi:hypothetical protein
MVIIGMALMRVALRPVASLGNTTRASLIHSPRVEFE